MTDYKFSGWGAFGTDSIEGKLKKFTYEPKKWDEGDVDIKIQYSGVCGSDLHTISGGWGEVDYPQVVGHEIVGVAVRVGSKVTHVKVGDIVGVGCQSESCGECEQCHAHREPYCVDGMIGTYNGVYKRGAGKGDKSYGGYADYHRAPGNFVIPIPAGLDPAFAAPMLCGGVTVYSPLKANGAGTTAKEVGIIGIGGLGHFGILLASALGANVTAISHSNHKEEAARKLGAKHFIATHGDDNVYAKHARSLDLIICTTNQDDMPLHQYLSLLKPGGKFVIVGAPEKPFKEVSPFMFILNNVSLVGSLIGSPSEIKEMLALAAKQQIHPWIEKRDLEDVNQTIVDMHASKARYRYVLVNTANGGQL